VVVRHLDGHTIANQSLDPVLLHLARRVGHDLVASVELNAIACVGQDLDHKAFELDEFFLGHFFIPSDCRLHRGESRCCRLTGCYDAETRRRQSRWQPAAAARVDLACAARCHGPAAAVCRLHVRTAALCGSRSSMAEPAAETSGDPSPEWTCGSAS